MKDNTGLIVTVVVLAVVFGFLWAKGYLTGIRDYVLETREELAKCSWPSVEELKGSTVVVLVTIGLLGAFTMGIDYILNFSLRTLLGS